MWEVDARRTEDTFTEGNPSRGRESIFGGQIGSEDNGEGETPRQRPRWLMSPRHSVLGATRASPGRHLSGP